MANRRPQNNGGGRRMDFRNDRKSFGRSGLSPWQSAGPGAGLPNLLPLAGGSTEATLALASNIINLLQPQQNTVPSLLDMPIRRDFGPNIPHYDRGYPPNRMGNQGNFRRTGNYNRAGERINNYRKPFRPKDGQRQQNKSSPKKEADSKSKPVKESEQNEEKSTEDAEASTTTKDVETKTDDSKKDSSKPKTRYDDINHQLLKCHICNKSMWDGRSFENHLNGRAHAIMMQKTAESYALTADTMRQEFKIREMKRTRKSGQMPARDFYCAMCDMYAGDGAAHRTTVGHRKLKKYLHPACTTCHKEMPTRIELDEHRLSADHLRNMQGKQDTVAKPKPEVMVISTLEMEQMYLRDERRHRRGPDARHDDRHDHHDDRHDTKEGDEGQDEVKVKIEEGDGEEKQDPPVVTKIDTDTEDTILDFKEGDDLTDVTSERFPAYSTQRGVGESFLREFRCMECVLCRRVLRCERAAAVHVRTWRHHQQFLRLLAEKAQPQTVQETTTSNKRPLNSEEEGNWKRKKVTTEDQDEQNDEFENGHDNDINIKDEPKEPEPINDKEIPTSEDLEEWEQSIDEILEDENKTNPEPTQEEEPPASTEVTQESVESEEKLVEVNTEPKETENPPSPAPKVNDNKAKNSPRGRGRGRARGRGRY